MRYRNCEVGVFCIALIQGLTSVATKEQRMGWNSWGKGIFSICEIGFVTQRFSLGMIAILE